MKITIKDRINIHSYEPEEAILIRITSLSNLKEIKQKYKKIHLFYFDDINEETDYSITDEEAKELKEILNNNLNIKEIVIHCDYGKGRSAAVGIAYKELLGIDTTEDKIKFQDYNRLVYNKILKN